MRVLIVLSRGKVKVLRGVVFCSKLCFSIAHTHLWCFIKEKAGISYTWYTLWGAALKGSKMLCSPLVLQTVHEKHFLVLVSYNSTPHTHYAYDVQAGVFD